MHRTSKSSVIALMCTAALAVSACGASSKPNAQPSGKSASLPDNGATIIAAAFTKTSAVKTARMALTFQLTAGTATSSSGVNERGTGTGVIDFAHRLADLTVNEPTGQSIEERLIGTNAYVKLPPQLAQTQPQLRGKSWLHQQLPSNDTASLGFGSSGSGASDPTSVLRLVSMVSNSVAKVGTASIRGTQTTHYRAIVDFGKAAAKHGLPPAQIQTLEKALGTNTFPVDLWIDGQGVARRMQFHFPLAKATTTSAAGQSGQITETLDLYDFGTPVSVQPPPASQVANLSALGTAPGATTSSGVRKS
jgi:hypothetical protein